MIATIAFEISWVLYFIDAYLQDGRIGQIRDSRIKITHANLINKFTFKIKKQLVLHLF